jgi:outer membrane protein assembly factor BamB
MRTRKMLFCAVTIFIIGLSCAFQSIEISAAEQKKHDWPKWRGPKGDGISPETDWNPKALANGPKIVWKKNVGMGFSSVAIAGPFLYTMGNVKGKDIVYCLDVETGNVKWQFAYSCDLGQYPGPRATPTVDGSSVYTLSQEGDLHCLEASNGKVKWRVNIEEAFKVSSPTWGFAGSPVVEGELVILNAGRNGIAIDKKTGKKVWVSGSGAGGYATPVLYDDGGKRLAAVFGQTALYAVDAVSGSAIWSFPWKTDYDVNAADPVVMGKRVFISSGYGTGCALIEPDGTKARAVWDNGLIASHFSSLVRMGGHIYGNDGSALTGRGVFRCLDVETGKESWGANLGLGSLCAAGDKLILLTAKGDLFIVEASPSSYRVISSASGVLPSKCWTPPVFCRGRIYVRNHNGDIACVDVK